MSAEGLAKINTGALLFLGRGKEVATICIIGHVPPNSFKKYAGSPFFLVRGAGRLTNTLKDCFRRISLQNIYWSCSSWGGEKGW